MLLQIRLLTRPTSPEDAERQASAFLRTCDAALGDFMAVCGRKQPDVYCLSADMWEDCVAQARTILGDAAVRKALAYYD